MLVRVADDEGDRHRLAERPSQTEHDAADHADAGVWQHHAPDDFPGRGAEPVADSCSIGGTVSNTSRMTDAMNGSTMIARIKPAVSMPMPSGGPANRLPIPGIAPSVSISAGCDVLAEGTARRRTAPRCRR